MFVLARLAVVSLGVGIMNRTFTIVTLSLVCCALTALLAGLGCRAGTYNVSFGLSESGEEGLQNTRRLQREPLRDRRERETDRLLNDLDGDGIPNNKDPDIDGDGIPNSQDPDDDNDKILDADDSDADGDGVIDDLAR